MWILYLFGVSFYGFLIQLSALFNNEKAKKWIKGRRDQKESIRKLRAINEKRIWFHCASLGEFEQGKPVMEAVKREYPNHKIVLTFFSPSGYEIRKNDPIADYIFYLPLDGPKRSRSFIKSIKPELAFFVKYEFWYFYGRELQRQKISFFCISAIFRPNQIFFQPIIGEFFRRMLLRFTHLFVQDQESLQLLYKDRVARVSVSGDTRFDRVSATKQSMENEKVDLPLIKQFIKDENVWVYGSTWSEDLNVILPFIDSTKGKHILVPHEIKLETILNIQKSIKKTTVLYSEYGKLVNDNAEVLIIDSIGLLSRIYKYANYSYVGGGFGVGIHNILEAAVYGLPVFFGPEYDKFKEAKDLVKLGGAFSINNVDELMKQVEMISSKEELAKIADINKEYVEGHEGATAVVINYLQMNHQY
jgi:3-deoxy-D-manno-octulosonic-acid transferase